MNLVEIQHAADDVANGLNTLCVYRIIVDSYRCYIFRIMNIVVESKIQLLRKFAKDHLLENN